MKDMLARLRGLLFRAGCKLRKKNVAVGSGLKLYARLEIRGPGVVSIGENCVVARMIGDERHYVTIYTHSRSAVVSIGANAVLYSARISSKFAISAGDDLLIEESQIADTDFHSMALDRGEPKESKEACWVRIGNNVSIGARSVISKGVTIGDGVSILPGTIVNKNIPAGAVVCGNPARAVAV